MRNLQVNLSDRHNAATGRGGSSFAVALSVESQRLLGVIQAYATPKVITGSAAIRLAIRDLAERLQADRRGEECLLAAAAVPAGLPPAQDAGRWVRELSHDERFALSEADQESYAAWHRPLVAARMAESSRKVRAEWLAEHPEDAREGEPGYVPPDDTALLPEDDGL